MPNNNGAIVSELGAATQQSSAEFANLPVRKEIMPVIEVNPKLMRTVDIHLRNAAINATSATLGILNSTEDFYIVACELSMLKDVTATSTASQLKANIGGATRVLLEIIGLTLTAQSGSVSVSFPHPVKIDKGTSITVANSTNVGNVSAVGIVYGYYEKTSGY
jgi:hypothetical protein